jgi:hypothetical protein
MAAVVAANLPNPLLRRGSAQVVELDIFTLFPARKAGANAAVR